MLGPLGIRRVLWWLQAAARGHSCPLGCEAQRGLPAHLLRSSLRAPETHQGETEASDELRGPGQHFLFLTCITQHWLG